MSLLDAILAPEQRAEPSEKSIRFWGANWSISTSAAGETVNETTALALSAFFACMRVIAEDCGKLPLGVFRRLDPRGRERVTDHPADYLLHSAPNDEMNAMVFRETLTAHAIVWSSGYAEITRDGRGHPTGLFLLDPTTVKPVRAAPKAPLRYEITINGQKQGELPARDVLHVHGLGYSGHGGYSIPRLAREALGAALATQKFAGTFFGNGAMPGGVIEHPETLSDAANEHLGESFVERHGGADKAHRLAVLEEGMTYKALSIPPEQAQFIQTRQFQVVDVARWFRMPPHKIQDLLRSTFSNIEHQSLEYVGDTLMPWLVRWEEECARKLFLPAERDLYVKHNITSLLRADAKTRGEYYSKMFHIGAMSINEILELEDRNPVEGGDTRFVPVNVQPLEVAVARINEPEPEPEPVPDEEEEDEEENERARQTVAAVFRASRPGLTAALRRLLHTEGDKAGRARKRGRAALAKWAEKFYAGHEQHVRDAVAPILESAVGALGVLMPDLAVPPGLFDRQLTALAERHCEHSRADINHLRDDPAAIDDWQADRAETQAELELDRLGDIIAGRCLPPPPQGEEEDGTRDEDA